MLKVVSPTDILLNEASKNETVVSLIDNVNSFLSEEDEKYSYSYKIETSSNFTKREKYLIEKVFLFYGWVVSISTSYNGDKKVYSHNFYLTAKS